jgi:hypothetical protein
MASPPHRPNLWSTECIILYHHLTKEISVGALECAEVKTHAGRHDARKHHVGMAFWAGMVLELDVDVAGHRTNFWHCVLPLKAAQAQRSRSPAVRLVRRCWMQLGLANAIALLSIDQGHEFSRDFA